MKQSGQQGARPSAQLLTAGVARSGFSLVEMAVVLVVIGLLLGGLLMPLSTQIEQQRILETRKTLDTVKEALLGYAAANGRLPCPASATSNGVESFDVGGDSSNGLCSNFLNGFLPAVTLGLHPVDNNGYSVDGWSLSANRIRYVVYTGTINATLNPFTRKDGMRNAGMANIGLMTQLLSVCSANSTSTDCTPGATVLTRLAPLIVYSLGKNAPTGGTGLDEAQNLNGDNIFVSHEMSAKTAPNGEFDDILSWMSVNTLFSRMMAAGSLP